MGEEINVPYTHVLTDIAIEEPDPRGSAETKRMVNAICRAFGTLISNT